MGATRDESSEEQVKMSPPAKIMSADFRKWAHYRLAAALTHTVGWSDVRQRGLTHDVPEERPARS